VLKAAEIRRNRWLALLVISVAVAVFFALFFFRRASLMLESRTTVRADFRMISGLRAGSPVQLAGVQVGHVERTDFVKVNYECDPLSEDMGRYGAGRTNNCDDFMFCAPNRRCAELEPFAGKGEHPRCDTSEECSAEEVCVRGEFRRHAPRVFWSGPLGVCARFITDHWRTRVVMNIHGSEETMDLIRNDSRAMIAANSVLGDQLVNISPGQGDPLDEDGHIQTRTSLFEDIERLRLRIESATRNADDSLLAFVTLINELREERFLNALKGTIDNIEIITYDVAFGEGLVGAMMNSQSYRQDVGQTVTALRRTGEGLDVAATRANHILDKVDRNAGPLLDDAGTTLEAIDGLLTDLEDPSNRSLGAKLLRDSDGQLAEDLEAVIKNTAEISRSIKSITESVDNGDGTLGKLINDPTLRHDIGKLLGNIATRDGLRAIVIWYLERQGIADAKAARSPVRPPSPRKRRR
jgi:ABC-type transporter Mla subunit MlaD